MLLLTEVIAISKKCNHKKDALEVYNTNHIKIVLALSTKIVALYI